MPFLIVCILPCAVSYVPFLNIGDNFEGFAAARLPELNIESKPGAFSSETAGKMATPPEEAASLDHLGHIPARDVSTRHS